MTRKYDQMSLKEVSGQWCVVHVSCLKETLGFEDIWTTSVSLVCGHDVGWTFSGSHGSSFQPSYEGLWKKINRHFNQCLLWQNQCVAFWKKLSAAIDLTSSERSYSNRKFLR